jgi:hypothetical protein
MGVSTDESAHVYHEMLSLTLAIVVLDESEIENQRLVLPTAFFLLHTVP